MKIEIKVDVSEYRKTITIDLADINLTELQWEQMTESDREDLLQKHIDDLPEQPYWCVDTFKLLDTL